MRQVFSSAVALHRQFAMIDRVGFQNVRFRLRKVVIFLKNQNFYRIQNLKKANQSL